MKYVGIILMLLLVLTACQGTNGDDSGNLPTVGYATVDSVPERFAQLEPPPPGSPIATIHTTMGDITFMLFPQYAPMAVENFTTLAERGHFDGALFYRVMPQFIIQAGIPSDSTTIWNGSFEAEIDTPLYHIRGAVGLAGYDGRSMSDFYIVQNSDMDYGFDYESRMSGHFREMIANPNMIWMNSWGMPFLPQDRPPVPFLEHYLAYGGMWRLDYPGFGVTPQKLTLFGQVIHGMDVVDAIAYVETSGEEIPPDGSLPNSPLEDIIILSITLGAY